MERPHAHGIEYAIKSGSTLPAGVVAIWGANMKRRIVPFSVPRTIDPDLARVHAYWKSLERGENKMPFWDDFKISSLPDLADKLMLVDVFEKPER